MLWYGLFCLALTPLVPVNAVFADDAFKVDYHHALLGIPQSHTTFFHRPRSATNASLLYTVSDKAVLGVVNPKDGSLLWRQSLAGQPVENAWDANLVASESDGRVVSGYDHKVSAWNALDGKLSWTYHMGDTNRVIGLQSVPTTATAESQDYVVLVSGDDGASSISRLVGDGISTKWEFTDETGDAPVSIAVSASKVYYISKHKAMLGIGKLRVTILDTVTGKQLKQSSPSIDSEIVAPSMLGAPSCSNVKFIVTSDTPYKSLKVLHLDTGKVSILTLDSKGEDIEQLNVQQSCDSNAPLHFLLHVRSPTRQWAEIFHVNPKSGDTTHAYSLPATAEHSTFTSSSVDNTVYFLRLTDSEISVYSSVSHGILGRWPRDTALAGRLVSAHGSSHAVAEVVVRGKMGLAIRVAESSEDGIWSLIRNGETQWSRPEMLAYATTATWTDDAIEKSLAQELKAEESVNPLSAYVHRVKRHLADLAALPFTITSLLSKKAVSAPVLTVAKSSSMLGSKSLVIATSRLQLICIDPINGGDVQWVQTLKTVDRSKSQILSLTSNAGTITSYHNDGSATILNATDGTEIDYKLGTIPAEKVIQIHGHHGDAIIKVSKEGVPYLATDLSPSVASEGNAIVTLNDEGAATGWTIGQSVIKAWTLRPNDHSKFVHGVARPHHDPVASIGKALGDRSVMYKYLSPNLVLLTATSATTLTLYLVDAITGSVLHAVGHAGIDPDFPIASAISENWFAYSFTGVDPGSSAISSQLVIVDLYESDLPNDRGTTLVYSNYSSYDPYAKSKPHVVTQAFTITEPISHMAVSQTSQGITSRQLLCTLPNSNGIIGIPRHALDPRRPVDRDPIAIEMEEGLYRYQPLLDFDPKFFLTHSREVMGAEKMLSSPTLLESTSLVFAFGHDIFGTRVSPSMAFDVLGKGFNKFQLVLTIVALGGGVAFMGPMVKKRQVDARWKL